MIALTIKTMTGICVSTVLVVLPRIFDFSEPARSNQDKLSVFLIMAYWIWVELGEGHRGKGYNVVLSLALLVGGIAFTLVLSPSSQLWFSLPYLKISLPLILLVSFVGFAIGRYLRRASPRT